MFIFWFILFILGAATVAVGLRLRKTATTAPVRKNDYGRVVPPVSKVASFWTRLSGGVVAGVSILFLLLGSFYTQDVGQSNVLRDWTGNIVGYESAPGLHAKAPWVDTVTFDVRNQRVVYINPDGQNSSGDNSGGKSDGPQITVQDADGVTDQIDIAVRYSLKADAVVDIYSQYLNEENLRSRLINNDIRSVVREISGNYSTLDLLTKRGDVQVEITEALESKWKNAGIVVEDVALQEIVVPESVRNSYSSAQEAEINVSTETSKLEAEKVRAQQKVVNAQAEADANQLLNASLTPNILQQRYLDTLKELAAAGNLVITDGTNSQILVQK